MKIDAVRKEMNSRSCGDMSHEFGDMSGHVQSQRVVSDDTSYYILINKNKQGNDTAKHQVGGYLKSNPIVFCDLHTLCWS